MKKLLLILLFPSLVFAQNTSQVVRNNDAATTIQSNNLGNSRIATDEKGRVFINPNQTPIPVSVSGGSISITTPIPVYPRPAPTSTISRVSDTASSTTCLALNANRLGAEFINDSTEIVYLKKGTTASTTSFTVRLMPQDYYFQEDGYTGRYDCIWANNASGAMEVTEVTP